MYLYKAKEKQDNLCILNVTNAYLFEENQQKLHHRTVTDKRYCYFDNCIITSLTQAQSLCKFLTITKLCCYHKHFFHLQTLI